MPSLTPPMNAAMFPTHMAAFAKHFVQPAFRARWQWLIAHDLQRLQAEYLKLPRQLDTRYCRQLIGAEKLRDKLVLRHGDRQGLYFAEREPACWCTAAEAAEREVEAILSFEAGKLALYLSHEGEIWHCQR